MVRFLGTAKGVLRPNACVEREMIQILPKFTVNVRGTCGLFLQGKLYTQLTLKNMHNI